MIKSLLSVFLFLGLLSSCTSNVDEAVSEEQQQLNSVKSEECEKGQCPCETPRGNVAHGALITVYNRSEVSCEETCEPHKEVYRCNNGQVVPETIAAEVVEASKDY
ncbi:MAG: hypothetical protein HRT44_02445, partial [Bdellovibrionales bacterium]|nr:hypothetical protein [Bdellovibrionales bacterium]NQZ18107.1 hypothetical protein [Bdellovibrionales bacterium]